jgi:hypothetical protein
MRPAVSDLSGKISESRGAWSEGAAATEPMNFHNSNHRR